MSKIIILQLLSGVQLGLCIAMWLSIGAAAWDRIFIAWTIVTVIWLIVYWRAKS